MPGGFAARAAQPSARSPHPVSGKSTVVKLVRVVKVASLGKPVLHPPTAGDDNADAAPPRPPGRTHGVSTLKLTAIPKNAVTKSIDSGYLMLRRIDGISYTGIMPPDTQVAAGPGIVVEMVNTVAEVFSAKGPMLTSYSLDSLFGTKGGTDPRVVYDPHYRVFFAAYELLPNGGDQIGLAVTSDPTASGTWMVYNVRSNASGTLYDQPRLGINSGTLMLAWDQFNSTGTKFLGEQFILVNKFGVVARASVVPAVIWTPGTQYDGLVPAASQSDGETEYAIYEYDTTTSNNATSSNAGVLKVQGVPGVSPVSYTETDLSIATESNPQPAAQPGIGPTFSLDTHDDRFQSAVWWGNSLWAAGNDGCTPQGDSTERSCIRLLRIGTIDAPIKETDVDIAWPGGYVMYPAVTDAAGTVYISLSASSVKVFASSAVVVIPNGVIHPVGTWSIFATGTLPLLCPTAKCLSTKRNRFGDYSGIALDPTDPLDVWVASEYGRQNNGDLSQWGRWGTEIAEFGP
jgi:hypothetical protein